MRKKFSLEVTTDVRQNADLFMEVDRIASLREPQLFEHRLPAGSIPRNAETGLIARQITTAIQSLLGPDRTKTTL